MNGSVNVVAASRIKNIYKYILEQLWADVTMRRNPSRSKLKRKTCKYFEGLLVWAEKGEIIGKVFRALL